MVIEKINEIQSVASSTRARNQVFAMCLTANRCVICMKNVSWRIEIRERSEKSKDKVDLGLFANTEVVFVWSREMKRGREEMEGREGVIGEGGGKK